MVQQKSSSMMALRDERVLASVHIAGTDTLLVLFVLFLDAFLGLFFVVTPCIFCVVSFLCLSEIDWIELDDQFLILGSIFPALSTLSLFYRDWVFVIRSTSKPHRSSVKPGDSKKCAHSKIWDRFRSRL